METGILWLWHWLKEFLLAANLLTRPVPYSNSLIDVCIGQPGLDRMEHKRFHLHSKCHRGTA